jgi:glycerophosphoryl diester phosphodiesterase
MSFLLKNSGVVPPHEKIAFPTLQVYLDSLIRAMTLSKEGRILTVTVSSPFLISHRGAAGCAPENTMPALKKAIELGVSFVEIDIRRSQDGVLSVIHDAFVDRTTDGHGLVGELLWKDIAALDAGAWFDPAFTGERIPRLEEVLEFMSRQKTTLIIEVKDPRRYPGIGGQLSEILKQYSMQQKVLVISFDRKWLAGFTKDHPEIKAGSLYRGVEREWQERRPEIMDVYWISVLFRPFFPRRAHKKGSIVVVWTVDSAFWMKILFSLGVDGITTNRPDIGMRLIKRE